MTAPRRGGLQVLLVGSGGREHALGWALAQSPLLGELHAMPGNPGLARIAQTHAWPAGGVEGVARWARERAVDLVVVGPEAPLVQGLADRLASQGVPCLGPSRLGARLESSKGFAKRIMARTGVPTARAQLFDHLDDALQALDRWPLPVVVKADGLASGKGVRVCTDRAEAQEFVKEVLLGERFRDAGRRVLLEEFLEGEERSVFVLTGGRRALLLGSARDYKRLLDGDRGPNTGGMGALSFPGLTSPALEEEVVERMVRPILGALREEGTPYRGVLYAGLMFTRDGPRVLEFNARLGDPETQVLLPRLDEDLLELFWQAATDDVDEGRARLSPLAAAGVVLADAGYPDHPKKGVPLPSAEAFGNRRAGAKGFTSREGAPESLLFHGATTVDGGRLVSRGGRVLTAVGLGNGLEEARQAAYRLVEQVRWPGGAFRGDIGVLAGVAEETRVPR